MMAGATTASATMAGTAISKHNKRSRGTLNASLYLYLPVFTTIAPKVRRRPTLYCTATGSATLPLGKTPGVHIPEGRMSSKLGSHVLF
jgi:hypothetical protein